MKHKFWRESREYAKLFLEEYEVDPDLARANLQERLKGKRKKICDQTVRLIQERLPGSLDGTC